MITTTHLAGPVATLTARLQPWTTELYILGGLLLGFCVVAVGVKGGVRQAFAKKSEASGATRDTLSGLGGIMLAAGILGAGVILVAFATSMGAAV